jgi:methyl-accepting chemotaxis protein
MDLSGRTEQSAANLEETAAAMEQIAVTVRNNESTVGEATRIADTNAQAAERGGQIIGQVVQTMQAINGSSSRIGDIIGTIDGIAFQTNILALNAAVEAARAGEQGRGFAVVASEVRALAQRSAAAAREIKTLITTSIEQVEGGTRVVRDAGTTIDEIVGSSRRVRELLAEVANGAREQTTGIAQSAKAVQELDTVTQQNAALVEQTAAAAGSLNDQAVGLAGEVAQFKLPA